MMYCYSARAYSLLPISQRGDGSATDEGVVRSTLTIRIPESAYARVRGLGKAVAVNENWGMLTAYAF